MVSQGDFNGVRELLKLMASNYPNMPLNCQLSFGYSRFLDLHIYNICKDKSDDYKLVHSLAYKEHSTFAYTSRHSNIDDKYKHAIVPISLHRAHTRCTQDADINHHLEFMSRILKTRSQDPERIRSGVLKFFRKKHRPSESLKNKFAENRKKTTTLLHDRVSKRHFFMKNLLTRSFRSRLRVVPKSLPNLGSILCPKRRVILKLSRSLKKSSSS